MLSCSPHSMPIHLADLLARWSISFSNLLRPLRQRPSEGGSGCPILKLTPSNLRRNTTKHRTPDKPCRRRAAATKTADPSGGEAVREAAALAHRHQTTHRTRSHRATERIECARLREGRSDAVKHSPAHGTGQHTLQNVAIVGRSASGTRCTASKHGAPDARARRAIRRDDYTYDRPSSGPEGVVPYLLKFFEEETARIGCIERVIPDVAVPIIALGVAGCLDERVGLEEAGQSWIVNPSIHVNQAHFVQLFMAGVTAAGSFGEPLRDHIGHQIPAIGVATLAPRVKAHGLDDVAAFVGDNVGRAQVVGVDERFIRLALLLEAAAGFNGVNGTGHGSAPGDGVAVARLDAFDVAQVAGGFGDQDAVLFELVGATEAVAARAVHTDSELLGPAIMNPAFTQNYLQGPPGCYRFIVHSWLASSSGKPALRRCSMM